MHRDAPLIPRTRGSPPGTSPSSPISKSLGSLDSTRSTEHRARYCVIKYTIALLSRAASVPQNKPVLPQHRRLHTCSLTRNTKPCVRAAPSITIVSSCVLSPNRPLKPSARCAHCARSQTPSYPACAFHPIHAGHVQLMQHIVSPCVSDSKALPRSPPPFLSRNEFRKPVFAGTLQN